MTTISEHELKLALQKCESEPIHQIGQIQAHGGLLVLTADSQHIVLQASNNLEIFFGLAAADILGKPLAHIVCPAASLQIESLMQKLADQAAVSGSVNLSQYTAQQEVQIYLYPSQGMLVLELELDEDRYQKAELVQLLLDMQQKLIVFDAETEVTPYFAKLTALLRELTDYDSVMLYRFDTNWDGEIITESRVDGVPTYLGLRFPASDIPPQARRLYTQNMVRLLADIDAMPVDIIPKLNPLTSLPLDMTHSVVRSMSPIHIEYLRNMGVKATMVISLLENERLWGLIACHHCSPKHTSIAMREAAVFLSRMASAKLGSFAALEQGRRAAELHIIISELTKNIAVEKGQAVLDHLLPKLQNLLAASGTILVIKNQRYVYGEVPTSAEIDALLLWLQQQATKIVSFEQLERHFPPASVYKQLASGLLAISGDKPHCIVWLRKERPLTVNWAGKAEKDLTQDAAGHFQLNPRKSFEKWTESWRGRSAPWTQTDMSLAEFLKLTLPDSLVQKFHLENAQEMRERSEAAEKAIRQQLERQQQELKRFEAIVNLSDDAIISKSLNGVIESWNHGAEQIFGYSAKEAIGLSITMLIPADRLDEENLFIQRIKNKQIVSHYETLRICKDGRLIDISVSVAPITDSNGEVVAISKIVRDISERKKYELALEREAQVDKAKLDVALASMNDAIFITDNAGVFIHFNQAFAKFLRFKSKAECPLTFDEYVSFLQVCLPNWEPLPKEEWLVSRALRGESGSNIELNLMRIDTGEKWIGSYSFAPIRHASGEILGVVVTARDITEQKNIEIALKESQEAANAANQAKSSFLANMSHEIRTPLNAVLGLCYLLKKRQLDDDSQSLITKIHDASHSLLGIINDILDFSKIEAGRLEIENVAFSLSVLIDHLAVLMSNVAGSKHLELIIIPCQINALIGDGMRLQQVLVNLLSNAIKFTERGEVELRISLVEQNGKQLKLRFAVKDTGIGISKEQQQNIFTAFTQADNSISRRFGGSGLGLSICAQLVHLMGGELRVNSEVDQGSEFWFELPFVDNAAAETPVLNLVNLNLLVVDDSTAAREALAMTVHNLGWEADAVDSGHAAISQVRQTIENRGAYDVLLLDWKMPGLDGLTTAKSIRNIIAAEKHRLQFSPIVLMVTAYDQNDLQSQPGIDVVDGVLSKPVTASTLYDTVKTVLYRQNAVLSQPITQAETTKQQIPGVRVLLVDDSEINREVASAILIAEGAVVSLANEGQAAIDFLYAHPDEIDIVLMDIQMPVMDGYTATRQIRQNPQWAKLPVIALTAGAFKDSQDAAQAAGLNDFIAKPFNVQQLLSCIQRWTGIKPAEASTIKCIGTQHNAELGLDEALAMDDSNVSVFDLPGINFDTGLKIWRQLDRYRIFVAKFLDQFQRAGLEMMQLAEQGDTVAIAALAHKLKGSSATLGLENIAQQSVAVETVLKQGGSILLAGRDLQQAIDEVSTSLLAWPETASLNNASFKVSQPSPANLTAIAALLADLLLALNEDNPSFSNPIVVKLEQLIPEEELLPIKLKIQDFDFRQAESLTRKLLHRYQQ